MAPQPAAGRCCRNALMIFGVLAVVLALLQPAAKRHFAGGVCAPELLTQPLSGKHYVITGANTGIGYETALQLARQEATVILAVRSRARGEDAAARIRTQLPGGAYTLKVHELDLASFASVRAFASWYLKEHSRLDGLVNNAGVMFPPFSTTKDGHELTFQANHLSHFLLTDLLKDILVRSAPSRIIAVSSLAHNRGDPDFSDMDWKTRSYGLGIQAYADSKLANMLHARELATRLKDSGVTAVSLHPGTVHTELQRNMPSFVTWLADTVLAPLYHTIMKTPWEGAQTTLHTLLSPDVPAHNGEYYADAAPLAVKNAAFSDANAKRLWELSEALVAAK